MGGLPAGARSAGEPEVVLNLVSAVPRLLRCGRPRGRGDARALLDLTPPVGRLPDVLVAVELQRRGDRLTDASQLLSVLIGGVIGQALSDRAALLQPVQAADGGGAVSL